MRAQDAEMKPAYPSHIAGYSACAVAGDRPISLDSRAAEALGPWARSGAQTRLSLPIIQAPHHSSFHRLRRTLI